MRRLLYAATALLVSAAAYAVAGTISSFPITTVDLTPTLADKIGSTAFNTYTSGKRAKDSAQDVTIATKATTGTTGTFSNLSTTAADGTRSVNIRNVGAYTGPRTAGTIFYNATAMYFVDGATPAAKRMGSGSGGTADLSAFVTYTSLHKGEMATAQAQVYTNTDSGLTATTIKTAIDELKAYFSAQIDSLIATIVEAGIALKAAFSLTPSSGSLTFANVSTSGAPRFAQWTITNSGFANLSTGTFTKSGGNSTAFSSYTACQDKVIAPNGSCVTTARFFSAVAKNYSSVVSMASNAPDSPKVIRLYGTAIADSPYTSAFASNWAGTGETDSSNPAGGIYTGWTSETDTASKGTVTDGKYVTTYAGSYESANVVKTGLTARTDAELSFKFTTSSTTSGAVGHYVTLGVLTDGGGNAALVQMKSNGGTTWNQLNLTWYNNTANPVVRTSAFSWQADTVYTIKLRVKKSTSNGATDGIFETLVNGTRIDYIDNADTTATGVTGIKIGQVTSFNNLTQSLIFDDVTFGYK